MLKAAFEKMRLVGNLYTALKAEHRAALAFVRYMRPEAFGAESARPLFEELRKAVDAVESAEKENDELSYLPGCPKKR